ncbi:MAG: aspartyl/asparaginyl beta-hydroxylase domain-containing protein [Roseibium sp.]|uniref:aspartyl/asparaginyl beta-hydroxylase domain-containing protein n=1 Tax=Roseibium sp. TaxID=1936156 RepID=UPI002604694A|nr:aspartyl/asparaginyl beta-hydroxylase domain-containing protein [Roseibium sp.]MCV0424594.1 aspartyl/asparaginyl beta-hydroxylase domain-containing protein [Roseibium sp.]
MSAHASLDLRALARARRNPIAKKLGCLSEEDCERLARYYEDNQGENILLEAMQDRVSRGLEIENPAYLSENYAQVALQSQVATEECVSSNPNLDNWLPLDDNLVALITDQIGPAYRMRLSCLAEGAEIPRHVDDPRQTRVIAVLRGSHEFTFHLRGRDQAIAMTRGELWQVNTAFEHSVRNTGKISRIALLANLAKQAAQTGPDGGVGLAL